MDRRWLTDQLQAGKSYESIARDAGCSASKVSWWAKRYGLTSAHTDRHAARGGVDRLALEALVARDASVREMAAELQRSPTTIRHWLRRYGLATPTTRRRAQGTAALRYAVEEPTLDCTIHGPTRHVLRSGGYRCTKCRSEHVSARRRRVKQILVREAGGVCTRCGYAGTPRAMEFHHLDPSQKRFALGSRGLALSIETLRAEAAKCVLLCSNCHAEVEDGAPLQRDSPPTC